MSRREHCETSTLRPLFIFVLLSFSVICPELPIPPGGIIIYTGDRAELVCNQGYNASASTQRQCESSGNWNGEKWSCTSK